MNLKNRFTLSFSLLFSLFFGIVLFVVYQLFSDFRKEDYYDRLLEKVNQVAYSLRVQSFSSSHHFSNSDILISNKLSYQKVAIFDAKLNMVFQSDTVNPINILPQELAELTVDKPFYGIKNNREIVGKLFMDETQSRLIAVEAEDVYGYAKLHYLRDLLIWAFVSGLILVWLLSYYLSRSVLAPMDRLREKVQEITFQNLNNPISFRNRRDEISALSRAFNHMLERIDRAYHRQKEFTGNASHELRTPIARISTQIENIIQDKNLPDEFKKQIISVYEDVDQLSDIVTSLLILSRLDEADKKSQFKMLRVDEVVFDAADKIRKSFPDIKIQFDIQNQTKQELLLEVLGDETLLKIAFTNLIKNAYSYSDNKQVSILINQNEEDYHIQIENSGPVPVFPNNGAMFQAFSRGNNSLNKSGSGLGLRIVQRIIHYHSAEVFYTSNNDNNNQMNLRFKRN
ncbi:MAG: HAMP domain-containing sensor histidine kinase [Bacteroidia bacterium]